MSPGRALQTTPGPPPSNTRSTLPCAALRCAAGCAVVAVTAVRTGAYGCTISGAGPTAVAVVPDPETGARVAQAMGAAFKAAGLGVNSSKVVPLDPQGAKFV